MTTALLSLLGFGIITLACYVCYHAGKSDQKAKELHDHLSSNRKTVFVRDRLRRDAGYAARVRARFTR